MMSMGQSRRARALTPPPLGLNVTQIGVNSPAPHPRIRTMSMARGGNTGGSAYAISSPGRPRGPGASSRLSRTHATVAQGREPERSAAARGCPLGGVGQDGRARVSGQGEMHTRGVEVEESASRRYLPPATHTQAQTAYAFLTRTCAQYLPCAPAAPNHPKTALKLRAEPPAGHSFPLPHL